MLAISKFDIPGEYGFPLNSVYAKPTSPQESGMMNFLLVFLHLGIKLCKCFSLSIFCYFRFNETVFAAVET